MAGIYIHIPFCKQACHYCNFHFSASTKLLDPMVQAICKEIELQQHFFEAPNALIDTIYFIFLLHQGPTNPAVNTASIQITSIG